MQPDLGGDSVRSEGAVLLFMPQEGAQSGSLPAVPQSR